MLGRGRAAVGRGRRAALRVADRACAEALRGNPAWRPEAQRLHETLAWLAGDAATARARWPRSLETAEALGTPVERARTLREMGDRLGEVAPLDEAISAFERAGARVDLAFALHARARLAGAAGEEAAATCARYDGAIALLADVKAEHALGLARQARAVLHARLGRADLATARRCFAAVGARGGAGGPAARGVKPPASAGRHDAVWTRSIRSIRRRTWARGQPGRPRFMA